MLKIFISTSKIQSPSTGKKLLSPFSKKFKKSSVLWLDRQKRDHYTKKARRMNYRSRAAFKLLELNISSNILHRGNRVFDLGCSPGGWSQVAAQLVRSPPNNPKVYGIDLLETDPVNIFPQFFSNFSILQKFFKFSFNFEKIFFNFYFQV